MSSTSAKKRKHRVSEDDDHCADDSSSLDARDQHTRHRQHNLYPCQEKPLKLVKREVPTDYYDDLDDDDDDDEDLDEVVEEEDDEDDEDDDASNGLAALTGGQHNIATAIALAFPALAKVKVTTRGVCRTGLPRESVRKTAH